MNEKRDQEYSNQELNTTLLQDWLLHTCNRLRTIVILRTY
jgi:hypothetical protein